MLNVILYGESVINDAIAIVLYRFFTGLMMSTGTGGEFLVAILGLIAVVIGSTIAGIFLAFICAFVLKFMTENGLNGSENGGHITDAAIILLCSYLAFELAESLQLSGIVSSLVSGFTMSYYAMHNISENSRQFSKRCIHLLAEVSEALIFFQVGENIPLYITGALNWGFVVYIYFFCVVGRGIITTVLSYLINKSSSDPQKVSLPHQLMLWNSGLRGAIAFALAISFPSQNREQIIGTTMVRTILTKPQSRAAMTCIEHCLHIHSHSRHS